jgi:EpsI family protein
MKRNSYLYPLVLLLLLASAITAHFLDRASSREQAPLRSPLEQFPADFSGWRQIDAQTLGAGAMRELGADEFLSRTYTAENGAYVYLSIAWYASQRHRQTFHSPQNCMPGAGWTMNHHLLHDIDGFSGVAGQGNLINEYRIAKDGARMIAIYWYQGRGRAVASEYWGRWQTLKDAIRLGRTDGALVRVIAPLGRGDDAEEKARGAALDFTRALLPLLPRYVPD